MTCPYLSPRVITLFATTNTHWKAIMKPIKSFLYDYNAWPTSQIHQTGDTLYPRATPSFLHNLGASPGPRLDFMCFPWWYLF